LPSDAFWFWLQDHTTRESRGFAFVRFFDKRDAEVCR
jgi:hypothetical protein